GSQHPPDEDRGPDRNEHDGPDRERALDPSDDELLARSVVDQRLAGEFDGAPQVPARAGTRPWLVDAQCDDGAEQIADREHEEIGATASTDDAPSGGGHDTPPAWIAAPVKRLRCTGSGCAAGGRRAGRGGEGGEPGMRQHDNPAGVVKARGGRASWRRATVVPAARLAPQRSLGEISRPAVAALVRGEMG